MEEVPFKTLKIFSWLNLNIHPQTYWRVASKIRRCYRGPTLNAFGYYRYFQMKFSCFNLYYKRFQWSPLSDFEKSVNFSFINGILRRLTLSTRGQLFCRNPGMRNITQKLLTSYIFRSCTSSDWKNLLLRNLVYSNHKRCKPILLTGTFNWVCFYRRCSTEFHRGIVQNFH